MPGGPLKKNSLVGLGDQFFLYAANDDVRLHHWILKAKLLLPISSALMQNVAPIVRRKPPQVFLEMSDPPFSLS